MGAKYSSTTLLSHFVCGLPLAKYMYTDRVHIHCCERTPKLTLQKSRALTLQRKTDKAARERKRRQRRWRDIDTHRSNVVRLPSSVAMMMPSIMHALLSVNREG